MQEFDPSPLEPVAPVLPNTVKVGGCIVLVLAVVRLAMGWLMVTDPGHREFVTAWGNILVTESVIVAALAVLTLQGRMWSYIVVLPLTVLDVAGAAFVGEQFAMLGEIAAFVLLVAGYKELKTYSARRSAPKHEDSPASLNL